MIQRISVEKSVLEWAIKESRHDIEFIQDRHPIIFEYINGNKQPTFLQLKNISEFLKIPFGLFFLKTPPQEDRFAVEFRTLNNKTNHEYSKDLKDVILEMDYRKEWMSEYNKKNGVEPFALLKNINLKNYAEVVEKILLDLNLDNDWYKKCKTTWEAFTLIRNRIESKGILVMLSGIVGNNTHRILDISEFRAFALKDKYAPLIFINRNDTETGVLFSLMHEYIHLIIDDEQDDILLNKDDQTQIEREINAVVAEFLVPEKVLIKMFNDSNEPIIEIKSIAKRLNISSSVVAIKAYNMELINLEDKNEIIREARFHFLRTKEVRETKGGNFYTTTMSRMSKRFYTTVVHQAEGGNLQFTEAYKLLSLNGKTYTKFKKVIDQKLYE